MTPLHGAVLGVLGSPFYICGCNNILIKWQSVASFSFCDLFDMNAPIVEIVYCVDIYILILL